MFLFCQLHLNDFLNATTFQFDRNANKEVVNTIFSFQIGGTGQDLFPVFKDCIGHFNGCRGWRVIGTSCL